METFTFGANKSIEDSRTVKFGMFAKGSLLGKPRKYIVPLDKYPMNEMIDQFQIGICTACAEVRAQEEFHNDGIRLDEWWGYIMQKVLIDDPMYNGYHFEGSSGLTAMKRANRYGTPTKEMFKKYPLKVNGTYKEFWDDFQKTYGGKIPQQILDNALLHKIPGYYQIPIDPVQMAENLDAGKVLVTRMDVGENFYKPSHKTEDLMPLRKPDRIQSGHLIDVNGYDFNGSYWTFSGPNSWGIRWCKNNNKYGSGYFWYLFDTQKNYVTEAWAIMDEAPKFVFIRVMKLGDSGAEVTALQKVLEGEKLLVMPVGVSYGFFGNLTMQAVIKYQEKYADEILKPLGLTNGTGKVGLMTLKHLNK